LALFVFIVCGGPWFSRRHDRVPAWTR
jgi:hypothetical protein